MHELLGERTAADDEKPTKGKKQKKEKPATAKVEVSLSFEFSVCFLFVYALILILHFCACVKKAAVEAVPLHLNPFSTFPHPNQNFTVLYGLYMNDMT